MIPINQAAQEVFNNLIQQLEKHEYIKLKSEGYMPLSFECIGHLSCGYGMAKMYSLMHTFTQNGDLMRDPEICFFDFEDHKQNKIHGAFPYCYQLDPLGIYQESIQIINGEMYVNTLLQKQHADFANIWLRNIKDQGFV